MRGRSRSRGASRATAQFTPDSLSGLAAWFDSSSDDWFTFSSGASISAWASRGGSLGAVSWSQGTAANQATRATSVAALGNKNAVLFDGSDDYFDISNANGVKFLHDGTGATIFLVERHDSTGGATVNFLFNNNSSASELGIFHQISTTSLLMRVGNGSGTYLNNWTNSTAGHFARDVSRWRAWSYVDGTQTSAISGSTVTNTDTAAQDPSASNPSRTLRLGAGVTASSPFKGYIAQVIVYTRVLGALELAKLGAWAATNYGVTA